LAELRRPAWKSQSAWAESCKEDEKTQGRDGGPSKNHSPSQLAAQGKPRTTFRQLHAFSLSRPAPGMAIYLLPEIYRTLGSTLHRRRPAWYIELT
jgi:hypothetical protein